MYWRPNTTMLRPASQKLHPDQARKTMYFSHEFSRRHTNHIKDLNGSCSKRRAHTKKTLQIDAPEAFQGKLCM